jgi:preprotein translocase SecE subunit
MFTYLKHVREELAHVAWPSTRTAIAHTLVVIVIAVIIAAWVGVLDSVFTSIVSRVVGA